MERHHKKDCYAIGDVMEGYWEHPWGVIVDEFLTRDKNGGKRGNSTVWFSVGCNSTNCDALILVALDDVMKQVAVD